MSKQDMVYVVTEGAYSDYHIVAIFTDRSAADGYVERWKAVAPNLEYLHIDVEEYPVDRVTDSDWRRGWECEILLEDGYIGTVWEKACYCPPRFTDTRWHSNRIDCCSTVSADHVTKLAVEARQAWLRNGRKRPS